MRDTFNVLNRRGNLEFPVDAGLVWRWSDEIRPSLLIINFILFFKNLGAKWYRLGVENYLCKAEGSEGLCKNAELDKCQY